MCFWCRITSIDITIQKSIVIIPFHSIPEKSANKNMKVYEQVAEEVKGTATLAFVNWYVHEMNSL